MKILYLAHRIPYPPDKGDKIRAYHQIRHLAERHDVHLYTLVDDEDDWLWVPELEQICARVHAFRLSPWGAIARAGTACAFGAAFSPAFFGESRLQAAVAEAVEKQNFDAAIVFCSAMMAALPKRTGNLPILADYCDLDSAKWEAYANRSHPPRSWLFSAEARRLAAFEIRGAGRSCRTVFATGLEAEDFMRLPGGSSQPVEVIPNGVDHAAFARSEVEPDSEPSVIFTGAMDYRPNHEGAVWFLDRVWEGVRAQMPRARLYIVGRDPRPGLAAHDGRNGVRVTGTVPRIQPWLHRAWLSVAPLQVARGVQNKVLEAMASGVATMVSPAVSRGLEARTGIETLVVEGADAWTANVVRLLHNHDARAGLAQAGLSYVRSHHDWNAHGRAWERLLHLSTRTDARGVA